MSMPRRCAVPFLMASGLVAQVWQAPSVTTGPQGVLCQIVAGSPAGEVNQQFAVAPSQPVVASYATPWSAGFPDPVASLGDAYATVAITPNTWAGGGAGAALGQVIDIEWRARTSNYWSQGPSGSLVLNVSRVDFDVIFDFWSSEGLGVQLDALLMTGVLPFEPAEASVQVDIGNDGTYEFYGAAFLYSAVAAAGSGLLPAGSSQIRISGSCRTLGFDADSAGGTLRLRVAPSAAACSQVGDGCGGGGPTPSLRWGTARPEVGTFFPMSVGDLPTNTSLVAGLVGLDTGSFLGVPLPLDLGAAGMPGCVLQVDPIMPWITALPVTNGTAQWWLPIPGIGELIGVRFVAQALVDAPGANAAGLLLSNGVRGHIGT